MTEAQRALQTRPQKVHEIFMGRRRRFSLSLLALIGTFRDAYACMKKVSTAGRMMLRVFWSLCTYIKFRKVDCLSLLGMDF